MNEQGKFDEEILLQAKYIPMEAAKQKLAKTIQSGLP
jgi:hypothetical protein